MFTFIYNDGDEEKLRENCSHLNGNQIELENYINVKIFILNR